VVSQPHSPSILCAGTLKRSTAFNHNQSSSAEAEYDRLRELARQEHGKRSACLDKVGVEANESIMTLLSHPASLAKPMSAEMEQPPMSSQRRGRGMAR
jgi:hypothetical protein